MYSFSCDNSFFLLNQGVSNYFVNLSGSNSNESSNVGDFSRLSMGVRNKRL